MQLQSSVYDNKVSKDGTVKLETHNHKQPRNYVPININFADKIIYDQLPLTDIR